MTGGNLAETIELMISHGASIRCSFEIGNGKLAGALEVLEKPNLPERKYGRITELIERREPQPSYVARISSWLFGR